MRAFAKNLKNMRMAEGMTQKDMADNLTINLSTYQGYEALGTRHREPDLEMIAKIADVLKVTIDELVGR
jgi:transcriptional regulator with XRE-family HTH domain